MFKNLHKISSAVFLSLLICGNSAFAQTQPTYNQSDTNKVLPVGGTSDPSASKNPALSDNSPDGKDAAGVGLKNVFDEIKSDYDSLNTSWHQGVTDNTAGAISKAYAAYSENWQKCVDRQELAAYACLENWSPAIQDGVAALNVLINTVGSAAVKDSCSTFAKAMDIAKYAFTTYTAACGAAKAGCGLSCVAARDAVASLNKALAAQPTIVCPGGPTDQTCRTPYYAQRKRMQQHVQEEIPNSDKRTMAGKAAICTGKYAELLASGAAGIFGIVNSMKQGQNCDNQSNADGTTTSATTSETCSIAANAQLPECICLKNPMLEGCGSIAAKATNNASGGLSALSATPSTSTSGLSGSDLAGGTKGIDTTGTRNPSSASGSNGVGAPTGGGSGLGGSGGGGTGSPTGAADNKGATKAIDTNILGGSGGGGGGGGFFGGDGGGGDKSGYRNYLPGGAKDPNKMSGQQQNWNKEVTGQGGKSNWEKVRERYQDNKSTLLHN